MGQISVNAESFYLVQNFLMRGSKFFFKKINLTGQHENHGKYFCALLSLFLSFLISLNLHSHTDMDTRARTHPIRTHTHAHEHCDSCHTHLCCKCTPCWLYHVCSTALGAHRAVGTRPRLSAPQTMCPLVFVHPSFTLLSLKRCVHEVFPGIHRCDLSTSSTAGWAWGAEHTTLVMTTLSQVTTSLAFVYIIFICGSVFIVFFTLACRRKPVFFLLLLLLLLLLLRWIMNTLISYCE